MNNNSNSNGQQPQLTDAQRMAYIQQQQQASERHRFMMLQMMQQQQQGLLMQQRPTSPVDPRSLLRQQILQRQLSNNPQSLQGYYQHSGHRPPFQPSISQQAQQAQLKQQQMMKIAFLQQQQAQQQQQMLQLKQQQMLQQQQLKQQQLKQQQKQQAKQQATAPINTYLPRLKAGSTALLVVESVEAVKKRQEALATRRSKWIEYSSDSDSFDEQSREETEEEEEEEENGVDIETSVEPLNKKKRKPLPILPNKLPDKRMRRLPKHEFDKLYFYRSEAFSSLSQVLVPVRIELDFAGFKIRDIVAWNLNEQLFSVERFADTFCTDLNLGPDCLRKIVSDMKMQISDYREFYRIADIPAPPDTRVIIKLDITAGKLRLRDRFEWDLASDMDPDVFAQVLTRDLHLGGEFGPLIANSIRLQVLRRRAEADYDTTFPIERPFRAEEEAKTWGPVVDLLDETELVEEEVEDDIGKARSSRRARREMRQNVPGGRKKTIEESRLNIRAELFMGTNYDAGIDVKRGEKAGPKLSDDQLKAWRCSHCKIHYDENYMIHHGPMGEYTLCNACGTKKNIKLLTIINFLFVLGIFYTANGSLPIHRLNLFR